MTTTFTAAAHIGTPGSPHESTRADPRFGALRTHGRFDYRPIVARDTYCWPNGARLAVYLGFNLEHFAFGEGLGANLGPLSPQPDVLNYSWREYGNRVGAWRCLDLFDDLALPAGIVMNTALLDHCPALIEACVKRGDELIAHGHTNAHRQSDFERAHERDLIVHCRARMAALTGQAPAGWLSPWISETLDTPDLLAQAGYRYTLNWCHDDRPVRMRTAHGPLWSIPYPQEVNDIPMIVGRQLDGAAFADMIVDQFDEMLAQAGHPTRGQPLVMGIALHPYLVGQPYRLRHLRRALAHIAQAARAGAIWMTTPGALSAHMDTVDGVETVDTGAAATIR
ncbi:Polysaccharide deacetylase [Paraburkholderia unamae]|uniref:polysaccharide deacetylase family protein n=1 Tax=Paraburkholderia unamae TaxID=219649 RepID=UPI001CB2F6D8|nr:polysaccharide deacetylase family protein [Paraburkholderia unamae]CAG9248903.1 Polysaccharide deacetylase [Paraburkholderia unamae]